MFVHKSSMKRSHSIPCVLCLSGLDPTGGAGLSADIEACAALGAHALPVATCLTAQDSHNVRSVTPVDCVDLARQIEVLLDDIKPAAVKIGLLGNADQIALIGPLLDQAAVPVVCDPVLRAGGGRELADTALSSALEKILLPRITVLTPNAA